MSSLAHNREIAPQSPLGVFDLPEIDRSIAVNRRFVPRVKAPFQVRVSGENELLDGIDISFGGLMATSNSPTWPGNILSCELLLDGERERPVTITARVADLVSVTGLVGMRLRFEGVNNATRKRIAIWMGKMAPLF